MFLFNFYVRNEKLNVSCQLPQTTCCVANILHSIFDEVPDTPSSLHHPRPPLSGHHPWTSDATTTCVGPIASSARKAADFLAILYDESRGSYRTVATGCLRETRCGLIAIH